MALNIWRNLRYTERAPSQLASERGEHRDDSQFWSRSNGTRIERAPSQPVSIKARACKREDAILCLATATIIFNCSRHYPLCACSADEQVTSTQSVPLMKLRGRPCQRHEASSSRLPPGDRRQLDANSRNYVWNFSAYICCKFSHL